MQIVRKRCKTALIIAAAAALMDRAAIAGQYSITKISDTTIDSRGLVLDDAVDGYGIGINGNSFENSAIQTFNGWQYAAYWVKNGSAYHVAMARRQTGAATWQVADLTNSVFTNGLSGGANSRPSDAHNVVSFGIDQIDGTIHLAYDLHGHTLKYRASQTGVTTNPNSISAAQWTQSLFNAQQNNLTGSAINSVTYPHFFNTNTGALQFTYRTGGSGNGSNWMADYNGATQTWSNVHQYDNGATGTYFGTVTNGDTNRNSYINGATYGPSGRLYQSFTWREGATGAANHDINFVYSDDNGNTWKNNAGTTIGSVSPVVRFNLNSPGLIVVPLSESMSLMNQQAQAVSGNSAATERFHTLMWHRDTAKTTPSTSTVWDPTQSSYFHYWRDSLGNFHRNKLPGNVGQRPKIYFDANDNAIAIYQAGTFTSSGIYINSGDLIIAAASKASNWTDWKIIKTEAGPFVSETQADARLLAINGTLSVVMQETPGVLSPAQGTDMRVLDYTIALTPATDRSANATGNWSTASNWSGSAVPTGNTNALIGSNRTITLNSAAPALENHLVIGTGGSSGTLNVASGASLTVGGSVIVGRDASSVGTYSQTGGTLSSSRFVVGDFFNETSGGGTSVATISGGSLTTDELQIGVSANGSSSNSSFNLSGTGIVNINGEVIIADCGNTGLLNISSGTMTVAGDIREGFNGVNSSTLTVSGGTLDLTGNTISVDNVILNGGTIANASFSTLGGTGGVITRTDGATAAITLGSGSAGASIQNGNGLASLTKNTTGTLTLSGNSTYTGATFVSAGTLIVSGQLANTSGVTIGTGGGAAVLRAESAGALGTGNIQFDSTGNNSTARLELAGGASLSNTITLAGRTNNSVAIENISGSNSITGTISLAVGGGTYWIESDAGKLTLSAPTSISSIATGNRTVTLQGSGNGEISGAITNGSATVAVTKTGLGTWTLSGNNTYSGATLISAGTLEVGNGGTTGNISNLDLTNNGTLKFNRSNAYVFGNIISGTGGVTQAGSGTTTLSAANTFTGTTNVTSGSLLVSGEINSSAPANISAGAKLEVTSTGQVNLDLLTNHGTFTTANGAAVDGIAGTGSTSVTSGSLDSSRSIIQNTLSISGNASVHIATNGNATGVNKIKSLNIPTSGSGYAGMIDLHDNDLIIDYSGSSSSYSLVLDRVKSGLTLLGGNGTGIASTVVDLQTIPGTMLAVVDNAAVGGAITSLSGFTDFNFSNSVLVKYTWFGDCNLDGVVDSSDYALIDTGFTSSGTLDGWVFGDLNYDSVIDGSDYALIDTGFISQSGVLPEPTHLGFLAIIAGVGLKRCRRMIRR